MDGPRLSRGWEGDRALHVLVVEHDARVLDRTCTRLLAEGCDVSTRRSPRGLPELVERMRPDLVLLDVLTPGLDGQELFVLLARCRPNALPAIVLHSKLSRPMLRTVLDLDDVLGVIHKTENDDEFSENFRRLLDLLYTGGQLKTALAQSWVPAVSGTHRVADAEEVVVRPRALRRP